MRSLKPSRVNINEITLGLRDFFSRIKNKQSNLKQHCTNGSLLSKNLPLNLTKQIPLLPPFDPTNREVFDKLVTQALQLKLQQVVEQDLSFIESVKKQHQLWQQEQKILAEKRAKTKKFHNDMAFFLNLYFTVFCLMVVSVGIGVVVGTNLPEIVACRSQHSPCWHLRIRSKIIK